MNATLQAVVSANRIVARQARDLNVRAGEQVFTVLDRTDLQAFLSQHLGGARCVGEIPVIDALRLPGLDFEMVGLVLEENPDAITVVEKEFIVSYRSGYSPTITLEGEDASVHYLWNKLPDEGVKLPGGRAVSVTVKFHYDSYSEQDIPTLKKKVRECLNDRQWGSWPKPEIVIPDLSVEGSIVPEIVTAEYGHCIIDGTPLMAYGAVIVNGNRRYTTDPYFRAGWYRSSDEAVAQRQKVADRIELTRAELREQQERAAAKQEAETAKAKVSALCSRHGSSYGSILEPELRSRLYDRAYSSLPSTSTELKAWASESEALCAEVEGALAEVRRKEQAEIEQKVAVNAFVRSVARPLIAPGEEEDEYTVYGVPCEGHAPCDPKDADIWCLYSRQSFEGTGKDMFILVPHKGFRSKSVGENFYQLAESFLGGVEDDRMGAILGALEAEEPEAQREVIETTGASVEDLAARWGANIRRK